MESHLAHCDMEGSFGREQIDTTQRKSIERNITCMSNSEEPNFIIYNMIKEVDYLVETHNPSNNLGINDTDCNSASGFNRSRLSVSTMAFGATLPPALVTDYAEILKIAIEIF